MNEWKKEGQYWAEGGGRAYRPGLCTGFKAWGCRGALMLIHKNTLWKTLWLLTGDIRPVCNFSAKEKLHLLHFCLSGSELES